MNHTGLNHRAHLHNTWGFFPINVQPTFGVPGFTGCYFPHPHPRTRLLHLERGEGREGEGEKHRWNPQPRHVPCQGIKLAISQCTRTMLQPTEPHWLGLHRTFFICGWASVDVVGPLSALFQCHFIEGTRAPVDFSIWGPRTNLLCIPRDD